jgi:hypothetical protein
MQGSRRVYYAPAFLRNFTSKWLLLFWYTKLVAQKRRILGYPMTGRPLAKHCV